MNVLYKKFYEKLKLTIFNDIASNATLNHGFVNTPNGGFYGFWYFPDIDKNKLKKIGFSDNECIYFQIQKNKKNNVKIDTLAIKYLRDKENKDVHMQNQKIIFDYFKEKIGDSFIKGKFKNGTHGTVGYIEYDFGNITLNGTPMKNIDRDKIDANKNDINIPVCDDIKIRFMKLLIENYFDDFVLFLIKNNLKIK